MRFQVEEAIGAKHPFARPPFPDCQDVIPRKFRDFDDRIEPVVEAPEASGGCG